MTEPQSVPPSTGASSSTVTSDKLRQMLALVWRKNEGLLQERLQVLRRGYEILSKSRVDGACVDGQIQGSGSSIEATEIREATTAARAAAHKLAGVLGTFELSRGTELAREAELMLGQPGKLNAANIVRLGSLTAEVEAMVAAKSEEWKPAG